MTFVEKHMYVADPRINIDEDSVGMTPEGVKRLFFSQLAHIHPQSVRDGITVPINGERDNCMGQRELHRRGMGWFDARCFSDTQPTEEIVQLVAGSSLPKKEWVAPDPLPTPEPTEEPQDELDDIFEDEDEDRDI